MKKTCLFEFNTGPSYGCYGELGGYSISVYSNGEVIERTFLHGILEPNSEVVLAVIPELAKAIDSIIQMHSTELKSIPNELDNGIVDGSGDSFQFGDKKIYAWSIQRTDLSEFKQRNSDWYEECKENMMFENQVLDIYDEIVRMIQKFDVDTGLEIM